MYPSKPEQGQPAGPLAGLLPAVYRYLLAWSGDPAAARRLAEQTLELARRYPQDAAAAQPGSQAAWLLGLARYAHTFPAQTRRSRDDSPETALRPDQVEMAMVAQLKEQLARLPSRSAEAITLTYFAGLAPEDVAAVLGGGIGDVRKLVHDGLVSLQRLQDGAEQAADRANGHGLDGLGESLAELAERLAPEQDWLERTRQEPGVPSPAAPAPRGLPGAGARRLFILRRLRNLATWLTPVIITVALTISLLANLQAFRPPSPPTPLPAPVAVISSSATNASSYAGWLVPPDQEFCKDEQTRLSALMDMPAILDTSLLYTDPKKSSTDPLSRGWGCRIEITGTGADFPDLDAALDKAYSLLSAQEYILRDRFSCDNCLPNNYLFDEYTVGKGLTLVQPASKSQAILTLAWRPPGPTLCPSVGDISTLCPTPLAPQRQYALRLTLASGSADAALKNFLETWAKGDAAALDSLYGSLRQRTGSLDSLDRFAGLTRSNRVIPQFTATILENGGSWLRAKVQGALFSKLALPSIALPAFQVVIHRTNDQKGWMVTDISAQTLFPPSEDTLFWADATGQVIRYSLADGSQTALTGPGSYEPQNGASAAFKRDPAQISPDGDWLALVQPDTDQHRPATLLIDLEQPGKFVRMPYAARLAWWPRPQPWGLPSELAFFRLDAPRTLYRWTSPFSGEPAALATFDQDLLSLAWSPNGKWIAALVDRPSGPADLSSAMTWYLRPASLELVHASDGEITHRADVFIYARLDPSAIDLGWTEDGQQVWIRPTQTAVDVQSGRVSELVYPLISQESWTINDSLITPPNLDQNNWGAVVSPGLDLMAFGIGYNPGGQAGTIAVRPVGQPDRNLWPDIGIAHDFLDWTGDFYNLIAAGSENQPGTVTRIGALSGQRAEIATGVYWIGIGSKTSRLSSIMVENPVKMLPDPDLDSVWPCQTLGTIVSCLRMPPGWQVTKLGDFNDMVVISNLAYTYPYGLTSAPEGSVILQTYFLDGASTRYDQLAPPDEKGITWEETMVSGRMAIHQLRRTGLPQDADLLIFPVTGGYLMIYAEPGGAYSNPVVQKIISSIEFGP